MSVIVSIHPLADKLDMYGNPDISSAYSLSGHVSISLSSGFSLFDRRKTARLLLQSLSLTFEGQSETFLPGTGYSGVRLCSITRELAPCEPLELNNEGHEDSDESCAWNIVFNLPIPGWLPPSVTVGMEEVGIRYSLLATAKVLNLDEEPAGSWGFLSFCSPFRSRTKVVNARKTVKLRRLVLPFEGGSSPPLSNFVVKTSSSKKNKDDKTRIPDDILSKIQVMACVPQHIDLRQEIIPLTLRLRTKDMEAAEAKKIQVVDITVDVFQKEKCRHRPSATYNAQYPLPSTEMQPPNLPLLDPSPVSVSYDAGLYITSSAHEMVSRSFSLLPVEESGKYKLEDENYVFKTEESNMSNPPWYTMEASIPFTRSVCILDDGSSDTWAGRPRLRADTTGPHYHVQHEVSISLTCAYDLAGTSEKATERLNFCIPVVLSTMACYTPPVGMGLSSSIAVAASAPFSSHLLAPVTSSLPAYSQLYESNGDRKIDYSVPLPLYVPSSCPTESSSTSTSGISESESDFNEHFVDEQEKLLPGGRASVTALSI